MTAVPEMQTPEVPRRQHEYGVTPINELADREIAEETLYWLREAGKTIAMLQGQGIGGMMKAMMSRK